jgi:hypothetical protein
MVRMAVPSKSDNSHIKGEHGNVQIRNMAELGRGLAGSRLGHSIMVLPASVIASVIRGGSSRQVYHRVGAQSLVNIA